MCACVLNCHVNWVIERMFQSCCCTNHSQNQRKTYRVSGSCGNRRPGDQESIIGGHGLSLTFSFPQTLGFPQRGEGAGSNLILSYCRWAFFFLTVLGLHCCVWTFSSCCKQELLSSCSVWASHCSAFSCFGSQA